MGSSFWAIFFNGTGSPSFGEQGQGTVSLSISPSAEPPVFSESGQGVDTFDVDVEWTGGIPGGPVVYPYWENYPVYSVLVDWLNDGDFSAPGSDVTARTLTRTAISVSLGRDQLRALSPIKPGTTTLEINNVSRDYSPENISSPLYGNLVPGRPIWVTIAQGSFVYTFYRGFVDDFVILPNIEDRSLQMSCMDILARFQQVSLSTPLYGPGVRTGAAIGHLLDQLGWPADMRDIDQGASTIRWWWEEGTDGFAALNKILGAEGPPAIAFVDAPTGNFVFRDRHHRLERNNSLTVQAIFTGGTILEADGYTSLIPAADSEFETPLSGNWIIWANVSSLTRDTGTYYNGTSSLGIAATAAGNAQIIYNIKLAAYNKQPATIKAMIYSPVITTGNITLYWYDPNNSGLGHQTIGVNLVSGWNEYNSKFSPPANCAKASLWLTLVATATQSFNLDSVQYIPTATATFSRPVTYDIGWRDIVNTINIPVSQRDVSGEREAVWSSEEIITVPNAGTVQITAQASDPFTGAIIPAEDVDYSLQYGSVNISLSRTTGQSSVITITDTAGGSVLTSLQLRAYPVKVSKTTQVSTQDSPSADAYGIRGLPSTVDVSLACAEDVAAISQILLARYSQRRPIISLPVKNANGYRLLQQLSRDLSDRVHIIEAETGLDADCFIEQISHQGDQAGMLLSTTFGLEKDVTQPANVFTFDVSGKGFDQGSFGISGLDNPSSVFIFDHPTQGKFNVGVFGT